MLLLSRKPGEKLMIGEGITITVVEIKGPRVKIAIDAPDSMPVVRGELVQWIDLSSPDDFSPDASPDLVYTTEDATLPNLVVAE